MENSTLTRTRLRLRTALAEKSGHEFQSLFCSLLGEVLEGTSQTKRLGHLDQKGVDAIVVNSERNAVAVVIQCKGFERLEYGADQQEQCRKEIKKYKLKGPSTPEYWLVINRSIKQRHFRVELENDLAGLVSAGRAASTRLLDYEGMVDTIQKLASKRLLDWTNAKQKQLFEYYADRLQFVQYIEGVPFQNQRSSANPTLYIADRLARFYDRLPKHQSGKHRRAPRILVVQRG